MTHVKLFKIDKMSINPTNIVQDLVVVLLEDSTPPPQQGFEELETKLPKTCYFKDGTRKIDLILAYQTELLQPNSEIATFLQNLTVKGLQIEKERGKIFTYMEFVKIHAPYNTLQRYAKIFNVNLTNANPYYKYKQNFWFKWFVSDLVKPRPESKIYKRAENTLSGQKPTRMTTAERSYITYQILRHVRFGSADTDIGIDKLIDDSVIDMYPLHDGDYKWTETGPLTDRQLLYNFWAHFKYILMEQPIHLLEKYYGPKVAFYFAFTSFYTKLLLIPSLTGFLSLFSGWLFLMDSDGDYINKEVCSSNLKLCSNQDLKQLCRMFKWTYVIDNPITVIHVLLCAFWGAVFITLWQRRQAMLRLRWNLHSVQYDRTMRPEFKNYAPTRMSSITGEIEYYLPTYWKLYLWLLSHTFLLIMVCLLIFLIFATLWFKKYLTGILNYNEEINNSNEIEILLSTSVTALLFIFLYHVLKIILSSRFFNIEWLASLRMPRNQRQFERIYINKSFLIIFATHFTPLIYYAYVKGMFYTHPGDIQYDLSMISTLKSDVCKASGCLIEITLQLFMIMIVKNIQNVTEDVFVHFWTNYRNKKFLSTINAAQWEQDYVLATEPVNTLYIELTLQYAFMTFFNAAFPLAPLTVLTYIVIQKQIDAYKFTRLYRRPIIEKVADIGGWNDVMKVLTICGIFSNAIILAFRNDFIPRLLYRLKNGSMAGYIINSLSEFAVEDLHDSNLMKNKFGNVTICFYRGMRRGVQNERKYETDEDYYYVYFYRAVYFIIVHNVTLILTLFITYVIPEIPRKVKIKLAQDQAVVTEVAKEKLEKMIH